MLSIENLTNINIFLKIVNDKINFVAILAWLNKKKNKKI